MCGIAGFNLTLEDLKNINTTNLAVDLLHQIESRGTDAAGAAWWEDGTLMVQKDGMRARWFTEYMTMPSNVQNAILHTRMGTKGHESNNDNNHPIVTGKVVGVHNGCIWNDDDLFYDMGLEEYRIAQVDTEAIFASIAYGTLRDGKGHHRLAPTLPLVLERIEGSAAIAWFEIEGDSKLMHAARISSSPFYYGQTASGSFIFASESNHLKKACDNNGIELQYTSFLSEGEYITIKEGEISEPTKFEPADNRWSKSTTTHWTGATGQSYVTKGGKTTVTKNTPTTTTAPTTGTGSYPNNSSSNLPAVLTPPAGVAPVNQGVVLTKQFETAVSNLQPTQLDFDFKPCLASKMLHDHIIYYFDSSRNLEIEEADYQGKFNFRESAIRDWETRLTAQNFAHKDAWMQEMGSYIRPGMSILTDLPDHERLYGHVVLLPATFPQGSYILRVMIPNSRYPDGYETVLVERKLDEFLVLTAPPASEYDATNDPTI